jgi:hypothetical protein
VPLLVVTQPEINTPTIDNTTIRHSITPPTTRILPPPRNSTETRYGSKPRMSSKKHSYNVESGRARMRLSVRGAALPKE